MLAPSGAFLRMVLDASRGPNDKQMCLLVVAPQNGDLCKSEARELGARMPLPLATHH